MEAEPRRPLSVPHVSRRGEALRHGVGRLFVTAWGGSSFTALGGSSSRRGEALRHGVGRLFVTASLQFVYKSFFILSVSEVILLRVSEVRKRSRNRSSTCEVMARVPRGPAARRSVLASPTADRRPDAGGHVGF
ncbi:hypothetical protein EYF80_068112 [Liparis tanakae]|uniref:Uncharacterized protein n=1 Tax=Liparis tanakae TaxID=230148 RepID=A0A4Z2DZ28_9TELE|nr:hypothetical protein EYF80_068112 [Liparis tanakae]